MHTVAWIELLALWVLWFSPYVLLAPKVQKRESITVTGPSRRGLLLQVFSIAMLFLLRVPGAPRTDAPILIMAFILGMIACVMMWMAITHLGRQFRIQAGLYHDHELVRSGPYAVVRHPIYASLLAMTVVTGLFLTPWPWLVAAIAIHVVGTEIRVHTEEKLLASRFGDEFAKYKKSVPAYVPLVR
ncbi:MAG TPA: isoprenylcysteine carboxylmethyltransferase family protein [Bryobacteraceae bacterium]|jgi:protein-S-isoprenylcysteine O-methyltransferase Ste14|nr:isoprenylcysteine carboxylmethyltransferase family protein [Bryobacteraceae bacterium]